MNNLENILKDFDKNKVAEAMKAAETLVKNEEIRKAFSSVDKTAVSNLVSELDGKNKDEIMKTILRSDNKGITELLKKIKG